MQTVSKIPFEKAEEWLRERDEYSIDLPGEIVPENVSCTAMAIQEFDEHGKRQIEITCSCFAGATQAIGHVYISEDGTSEIDPEVRVGPAT
jgi:hypothetical protein